MTDHFAVYTPAGQTLRKKETAAERTATRYLGRCIDYTNVCLRKKTGPPPPTSILLGGDVLLDRDRSTS